MPDHTVSGDVDSMLRSANDAAIRSAIGVGTTDAPTFLAQTLAGQSLTGTQATSLVDLATTWNTTGTPTAIKLNVVETGVGSNAASKLLDLQVGGVSKFKVDKNGNVQTTFISTYGANALNLQYDATGIINVFTNLNLGASNSLLFGNNLILTRDADGILAQRNGSAAQALRIYNDYGAGVNFSRFALGFSGAVLNIGVEQGGTGTTLGVAIKSLVGVAIHVGTLATNVWNFANTGHFLAATDNTYDIGASGGNKPRNVYVGTSIFCASDFNGERDIYCGTGRYFRFNVGGATALSSSAAGVVTMADLSATNTTPRITLGGTTNLFPSLKRSTTYLQAKLADDSAFTNIQGKLTTDTAYTATTVVATGYITLYDSTGTAYRVPCAV